MNLLKALREYIIYSFFGIAPADKEFWPVWEQLMAIDRGLAPRL